MFFVGLGNIVSWVALLLGAIRFGMGLFVALQDDPAVRAAMTARYLGSGSSGRAIDQGLWMIGFAIVLGILVQIARGKSVKEGE